MIKDGFDEGDMVMEVVYTSKFGKIIKKCPGLHEYWLHGELVARGNSLCGPNPLCKPTKDDWEYCTSLLDLQSRKE